MNAAYEHLYPFTSRFVKISGFNYHYVDEGSGEPILMLHGNPTWSFYYRSLIKGLSSRFRVIAPDHIGCGLSDKPALKDYDYRLKNRIEDLNAFLEQLQIKKKLTLVLHDWGGMIGCAWGVNHPERIGRLIITNTAAFPKPAGKRLPLSLRLIRNAGPLAVLGVLGLNAFVRGALLTAPQKRLPGDVRAGLKAPYNSWRNRIATLKFVQDIPIKATDPSFTIVADTDRKLHKLGEIPILICWGGRDFVFDQTYLHEWRKRFPNAETHLFEKAGHYLLEDEPDKVLYSVKDFLIRNPIPLI